MLIDLQVINQIFKGYNIYNITVGYFKIVFGSLQMIP